MYIYIRNFAKAAGVIPDTLASKASSDRAASSAKPAFISCNWSVTVAGRAGGAAGSRIRDWERGVGHREEFFVHAQKNKHLSASCSVVSWLNVLAMFEMLQLARFRDEPTPCG